MLDRMENMRIRLGQHGGIAQQDRMIRDKKRSLDKALLYSYQGANVSAVGAEDTVYRALINPDKTKQNYDDKIISIDYNSNFVPGTVFNWNNTNTKWLIYLQDLTELAYFRGEIRKCRYEISWVDSQGEKHTTYAAVRGPVETKINFIQKNSVSVDEPNHTLNILLPKDEYSLEYFKRYSRFYITGSDICWRIEGFDSISMPGIIEITAVEYFSNKDTDTTKDGELLADAIRLKEVDPEPTGDIEGEGFIKPKTKHTYKYIGPFESNWEFDKKLPLEYEINGKEITIKWNNNYSGQFLLKYGLSERTIVVESLF